MELKKKLAYLLKDAVLTYVKSKNSWAFEQKVVDKSFNPSIHCNGGKNNVRKRNCKS